MVLVQFLQGFDILKGALRISINRMIKLEQKSKLKNIPRDSNKPLKKLTSQKIKPKKIPSQISLVLKISRKY